MKNEKTISLLVLALIIITGGAVYILYPNGVDKGSILDPRNDTVTQDPVTTTPSETLKKESVSYLGRDGVYVVKYTATGFVPKQLQIPKGKSVRFVNTSNTSMQVYSDAQSNPKFVELNQTKTVGNGGTYTFSFVNEGLWTYHNQAHPTDKANILVY